MSHCRCSFPADSFKYVGHPVFCYSYFPRSDHRIIFLSAVTPPGRILNVQFHNLLPIFRHQHPTRVNRHTFVTKWKWRHIKLARAILLMNLIGRCLPWIWAVVQASLLTFVSKFWAIHHSATQGCPTCCPQGRYLRPLVTKIASVIRFNSIIR
jgi:hypothetical protein